MPERKSFLLRVDPDTFDAVQKWAADDLRSVNGQVEFLLRRALRDAGRLRGESTPAGEAPRDAEPAAPEHEIAEDGLDIDPSRGAVDP